MIHKVRCKVFVGLVSFGVVLMPSLKAISQDAWNYGAQAVENDDISMTSVDEAENKHPKPSSRAVQWRGQRRLPRTKSCGNLATTAETEAARECCSIIGMTGKRIITEIFAHEQSQNEAFIGLEFWHPQHGWLPDDAVRRALTTKTEEARQADDACDIQAWAEPCVLGEKKRQGLHLTRAVQRKERCAPDVERINAIKEFRRFIAAGGIDASTGQTRAQNALQRGHYQQARFFLVDELQREVCAQSWHGKHLVHFAAEGGCLEQLCTDVAYDVALLKSRVRDGDEAGMTPLHFAAQGLHLSSLRYLKEQGATAACALLPDNEGKTPLHLALEAFDPKKSASKENWPEILQLLGAHVQPDFELDTVAHIAARKGMYKTLMWLKSRGISFTVPNKEGKTVENILVGQGIQNVEAHVSAAGAQFYVICWQNGNKGDVDAYA
jgi:hypothetical protein